MKIICRLYSIYIRLRPHLCSTSKTHSDETPRDCYLPSPLYENQIGNCFCPWFTSMQTKKLFSYFHVNVFFIGGDKCNQSSSRQGRRACRGGGLLVLSSPGIIKQGNWKWYLIDTAISTARPSLVPASPWLSHMPGHLSLAAGEGEGREWTRRGKFPFKPGTARSQGATCQSKGTALWKDTRGESFTWGKIDFKMSPHQRGAPYSSEVEHGQHCVSICMYNTPASFCYWCIDNKRELQMFYMPEYIYCICISAVRFYTFFKKSKLCIFLILFLFYPTHFLHGRLLFYNTKP